MIAPLSGAVPYRTDADLRAWRAAARLTQEQAAECFGVSRKVYQRWEAGAFPRDLSERMLATKCYGDHGVPQQTTWRNE